MSGLSSFAGSQQQQPFIPPDFKSSPNFLLDAAAPWLLPPAEKTARRKSSKSSKQHSKRHKKEKRQRRWKKQFGAYLLQLIGLVCLVLAAVKAFEPLTGVGFTLVIVGYKGSIGDGDARDVLKTEKKSHKKSQRRKEKEGEDKEAKHLKLEEDAE